MFWRRSDKREQRNALQQRALELLRQGVGSPVAEFRDGQWEAIEQLVVNRSRSLVVQRTGWGKSSVYFIATKLLREQGYGPSLLISPLLSLMRNQVQAAERLGVRAVTINSANFNEWQAVQQQVLAGQADVVHVSPERLANDYFVEHVLRLIAASIAMFIVDEAHCISDWGHDFRPDYRRITRIVQLLPPNVPVIATTATANDRVVRDVVEQLGRGLQVIRGPLARESLQLQTLRISRASGRLAWLSEHVPTLPGSGIIYTLTIQDSEIVAQWLQFQGIDAAAYHARLEPVVRTALEERLLRNGVKALVATVALGMGFDKPDLGFVIHFQRPGSVVHYYQQIGRAGRALENAYAVLMSGEEDDDIISYFIETAFPPEAHAQQILDALDDFDDGLTVEQLEAHVNLSRGDITKTLKLLSVESPAPVRYAGGRRWQTTPVVWRPAREKIERLTALRRHEQQRMTEYIDSSACLMQFLRADLDDPQARPCGRCAACLGQPAVPAQYSEQRRKTASQFLGRQYQSIRPRLKWPDELVIEPFGWSGWIDRQLRCEPGIALSRWNDGAWGSLVRRGKLEDLEFDQQLVTAFAWIIEYRLQPHPFPTWVTCVPSLGNPHLVPDFAERVAQELRLAFVPAVRKVRQTEPQKNMENSYQQARNLFGVFMVEQACVQPGPVLLIDDMVDSRWTFTMVGALLRAAGSGPAYPAALAVTTRG